MLVAYGKISFQNLNFLIRNVHPQRYILSNEAIPIEYYNYAADYFVKQLDDAILKNDCDLNPEFSDSIRESFVQYMIKKEKKDTLIMDKDVKVKYSSVTWKQSIRFYLTRVKLFMYLYILFRLKKIQTIDTYLLAQICFKIYQGLPSFK